MRRLKLGNKVLGGVEPPKQQPSEYKDDISRGKYELIKDVEPKIATPDWVSDVYRYAFSDVTSLRDFAFPVISTVTSGTDIRVTNTIGPNFSRRQQKDIEE